MVIICLPRVIQDADYFTYVISCSTDPAFLRNHIAPEVLAHPVQLDRNSIFQVPLIK